MEKEIEITGLIHVPENLTLEEFWIKFIDFIEANGWCFGGGMNEIIDGYYVNDDGTRGERAFEK